MKKVFISYSSQNLEFVRFVSKVLNNHGFDTWYSNECLNDMDNWAGKIVERMRQCDYFIVVLSESSISSGQVMNEVYLASQLNLPKIPVRIDKIPLTEELSYHLPLNAIDYYKMTDDDFFQLLLTSMKSHYDKIDILNEEKEHNHKLYDLMKLHTDSSFSDVETYGGYSWGINKSVIQNTEGGWLPCNVMIEEVDDTPFTFSDEFNNEYQCYYESNEFQKILRRGQNQTRWMLTSFYAYQNKLFLSIKKTEWSQTMFSWHHLMTDPERKKGAINDFFENESTDHPNSLCLHLVLIDSNDEIVATRIKKRKKNDYPSTIAITLGEQINSSDFRAGLGDNFVIQWLRRALSEEFGFSESEYHKYISEGSARIMSLNLEGDIFNFSLVCCVKLNCTCMELYEYYQLHRSSDDEFDELFTIKISEIMNILNQVFALSEKYHPSSFLRLFYSYIYITGKLPFEC